MLVFSLSSSHLLISSEGYCRQFQWTEAIGLHLIVFLLALCAWVMYDKDHRTETCTLCSLVSMCLQPQLAVDVPFLAHHEVDKAFLRVNTLEVVVPLKTCTVALGAFKVEKWINWLFHLHKIWILFTTPHLVVFLSFGKLLGYLLLAARYPPPFRAINIISSV